MTAMTPRAPSKRVYKSLQYFLNRSNVLAQYRQFLRTTIPLEADVRRDVRKQIRDGFESYRDLEDENHVGRLLRQSKDQLKMVSDLVDTATAKQRIANAAASASDLGITASASLSVVKKMEIHSMVQNSSTSNTRNTNTKDTWVDQESNLDDVKGRVGTGWPWKSNKPTKKLELEGIKRRYGTKSFLDEQ